MDLPDSLARVLNPLFSRMPVDHAMSQLVVTRGPQPDLALLVAEAVRQPELKSRPALAAGLWLYVDELDRSHVISQQIDDQTGSFWHGIMHRREGDFSNSHYWFRRVGTHPAMARIPGYDPHAFIDEVEESHDSPATHLVERQRQEWQVLFEWCAEQR